MYNDIYANSSMPLRAVPQKDPKALSPIKYSHGGRTHHQDYGRMVENW